MKILVIADTHGYIEPILKILNTDKSITNVVHLGDKVSDALKIKERFPNLIYHYVKGNNDFGTDAPIDLICSFFGNRFLLTHGHKYNVKYSMQNLWYRATEEDCKFVLFGHTHAKYYKNIDGILMLNPSSSGYYILTENGFSHHNF